MPCVKNELLSQWAHFYTFSLRKRLYTYLDKFKTSIVRPFEQYILICNKTIGSIQSRKSTLIYDFSFGPTYDR